MHAQQVLAQQSDQHTASTIEGIRGLASLVAFGITVFNVVKDNHDKAIEWLVVAVLLSPGHSHPLPDHTHPDQNIRF